MPDIPIRPGNHLSSGSGYSRLFGPLKTGPDFNVFPSKYKSTPSAAQTLNQNYQWRKARNKHFFQLEVLNNWGFLQSKHLPIKEGKNLRAPKNCLFCFAGINK
jgi:hypothetical protein